MSSGNGRNSELNIHSGGLESLYLDLIARSKTSHMVLAQIGQSLDGRIATENGHSHYVNGPESLEHLHRLRAVMDAVIVGAETAALDNPSLTTRLVPGPNPVRVVIDPAGRLPEDARLLHDCAGPVLLIRRRGAAEASSPNVETVFLESETSTDMFAPRTILSVLRQRGLRSVLIEGGGRTISRFIAEGVVDRLHIIVAPMLIGSGRAGLSLPVIENLRDAIRFEARRYDLGADTLFDCVLSPANSPETEE